MTKRDDEQAEIYENPENWVAAGPAVRVPFKKDPGQIITDEINSDPDEVRKLRDAIKDADAGKARPYRR